ncbi:hypothetical protein B0I35DRAFT_480333 [Stachybotrys elegans]|uniref:Inner kinetochore subunit AME1 domain-containing protein n=1 Tax=Stachybotrys elegans TaxID=80388 RepID=A0A8K0SM65_9HYPO|nr:hypothetical protein B0I35DRAFT_480333 [Stachybotrys elegans]
MATGREARAERLNERLRGAQRTNLGDDSFNFDIPGLVLPEPAPPSDTSESSAKEPAADEGRSDEVSGEGTPARRRSSRLATRSPDELPEPPQEPIQQDERTDPTLLDQPSPDADSAASSRSRQSVPDQPDEANSEPSAAESPPQPSSPPPPEPRRRSSQRLAVEEIAESPLDARAALSRIDIPTSGVLGSSNRLQDVLSTDGPGPASSSPLIRKVRRSMGAASSRAARQSRPEETMEEEADEPSPEKTASIHSHQGDELSSPEDEADESRISNHAEPQGADETEEEEEGEQAEEPEVYNGEETEEEQEEAEEIGVDEAAERIGRKRRRVSQSRLSPELGSSMMEESAIEESAPKRRRGKPTKSPVIQKQPAPRKTQPAAAKSKGPKSKTSKPRRRSEDGEDPTIEITVQGFVHNKKREDDASDTLVAAIPFANHSGESVVDVLAQVCEEVIATALTQFQQAAAEAPDAAKKKEARVKIRAVEAYREELSTRLLEHAIQLNHWHSLRKRVRHVQKEKLALREEILRLKAEREQVALRMDEVRIKHEQDSSDSKYQLNISSLMHDIELAVEQGTDAPELSRSEQKQAELANLDLVLARIVEQASSNSSSGGLLRQVKEFNAFLERAAVALETR